MWSQSAPPASEPPASWPGATPPPGPPPAAPPPSGRSWAGPAIGLGIVAVLVVVALVAVVVVGGSDGDDDTAADRSSTTDAPEDDEDLVFETVPLPGAPTTEPPFVPDPAPEPEGTDVDLTAVQLEAALLGPDVAFDMTPEASSEPQTSDRLTSADMDVTDECRSLLEEHEARGTRPNFGGGPAAAPRYAARRFNGSDVTVEHEVADGADVTIDDYRTLLTTCETIEWDAGTNRLAFTVLDETLELGDDVLRVVYTFGDDTTVQWVLWSRDSVISSVSVSELNGMPATTSDWVLERLEVLAHRADNALAEAIADR